MKKHKEATVTHTIDDKGRKAIDKPVKGSGGAQKLKEKLKQKYKDTDTATFTDREWGELNRTAQNGKGGFQNDAKAVMGVKKQKK